jgi:hypothetical protein
MNSSRITVAYIDDVEKSDTGDWPSCRRQINGPEQSATNLEYIQLPVKQFAQD